MLVILSVRSAIDWWWLCDTITSKNLFTCVSLLCCCRYCLWQLIDKNHQIYCGEFTATVFSELSFGRTHPSMWVRARQVPLFTDVNVTALFKCRVINVLPWGGLLTLAAALHRQYNATLQFTLTAIVDALCSFFLLHLILIMAFAAD